MNTKSKNPIENISNFSQLEYELTKSIIFNKEFTKSVTINKGRIQYVVIKNGLLKCIDAIKEDNVIIDRCIKEFSHRDDFIRCYYIYGSNIPNTKVCDTIKRFYFIIKKDDFEVTRDYFRIFDNKNNETLLNYDNIEITPYTEDEEEQLISWLLTNQNYKVYERNGNVKVVMNNETNII